MAEMRTNDVSTEPRRRRAAWALRPEDLFWLLGFPVYVVIGTIRHEGSHAIAALLEGARIQKLAFLPSVRPGGSILWGYVQYEGPTGWLTAAAPYLSDLLTCGIAFWPCMIIRFRHRWLWLNLVIVGLLSPLINSLYNYIGRGQGSDVGELLTTLSSAVVHLYFGITLLVYTLSAIVVFSYSVMARASCAREA